MSNNREHISSGWSGWRTLWWIVALILLFLLVILWLMGYGPGGKKCVVPPTIVEKIIEKRVEVEKIVNVEKPAAAPDTMAPKLSLLGSSEMKIPIGKQFVDRGATALDDVGGETVVKVTGLVDINKPGEYMLTYTSTDAAGNVSKATRKVIVVDETAPRLNLIGSALSRIQIGDNYVDAGASSMDNVGGKTDVKVSGKVDSSKAGEYILTYTSTDAAGNTSTVKRKVIVEPALAMAKLYFELDSAEFPADTELSLSTVIAYLRKNSSATAVISGFHDPSGNAAHNKELALNRAIAVRDLLQQSGITADRIELEKPEETTGTGSPKEARRVEVKARK